MYDYMVGGNMKMYKLTLIDTKDSFVNRVVPLHDKEIKLIIKSMAIRQK
jgi:hypothetical protein